MLLLALLLGCNPKAAKLRAAADLVDAGRYDHAVAAYDDIAARWPGTDTATEARAGAQTALIGRTRALYDRGDPVAAGRSLHDLSARATQAVAERQAAEAIGPGVVAAARCTTLVDGPRTDDALERVYTDVLSNTDAPVQIADLCRTWACDGRAEFPAYTACAIDPQSVPRPERASQAVQSTGACDELVRLGCEPGIQAELEAMADVAAERWATPRMHKTSASGALGTVDGSGIRTSAAGTGVSKDVATDTATVRPSATDSGATLTLGEPEVRGNSLQSEIELAVAADLDGLLACLRRDVPRGTSGRVTVDLVIEASGAVSSSTVHGSTLGRPDAETCAAKRLGKLRFAPVEGGGTTTVRQPLELVVAP